MAFDMDNEELKYTKYGKIIKAIKLLKNSDYLVNYRFDEYKLNEIENAIETLIEFAEEKIK